MFNGPVSCCRVVTLKWQFQSFGFKTPSEACAEVVGLKGAYISPFPTPVIVKEGLKTSQTVQTCTYSILKRFTGSIFMTSFVLP
jgi:hypothetical protein